MIYSICIKNRDGCLGLYFDNIDQMFERINDLPPGYHVVEGYIGYSMPETVKE
jgi:hypothetical protein